MTRYLTGLMLAAKMQEKEIAAIVLCGFVCEATYGAICAKNGGFMHVCWSDIVPAKIGDIE